MRLINIYVFTALSFFTVAFSQTNSPEARLEIEKSSNKNLYSVKTDPNNMVDLQSGIGNYNLPIATLKSGKLERSVSLNIKLGSLNYTSASTLNTAYGCNVSVDIGDGILSRTINDVEDSLRIRPQNIDELKNNENGFKGFIENATDPYNTQDSYLGQGNFNTNYEYVAYYDKIEKRYLYIDNLDLENDIYSVNFEGNFNYFTYNNGLKFLFANQDIKISKNPYLNIEYGGAIYSYAKDGRNRALMNTQTIKYGLDTKYRPATIFLPTKVEKYNDIIKYNYIDGNMSTNYSPSEIEHGYVKNDKFSNYFVELNINDNWVNEPYDFVYNQCIAMYDNPTSFNIQYCHNQAINDPRVHNASNAINELNDAQSYSNEIFITEKVVNEIISDETKVNFIYETINNSVYSKKILKRILVSDKDLTGAWQDKEIFVFNFKYTDELYILDNIKKYSINENTENLISSLKFEYFSDAKAKIDNRGFSINDVNYTKEHVVKKIVDNILGNTINIEYESSTTNGAELRIKEITLNDSSNTNNKITKRYIYEEFNDYLPKYFRSTTVAAIRIDERDIVDNDYLLSKVYSSSQIDNYFSNTPYYGKTTTLNDNGSYEITYFKSIGEVGLMKSYTLDYMISKKEYYSGNNRKILSQEYLYEDLVLPLISNNDSQNIVNSFNTGFYLSSSFNAWITDDSWNADTTNIYGPFNTYYYYTQPYFNFKKPTLKEIKTIEFFESGAQLEHVSKIIKDKRNLLTSEKTIYPDGTNTAVNFQYNEQRNILRKVSCRDNNIFNVKKFNYGNDNLLYEELEYGSENVELRHLSYKYDINNNIVEISDKKTNKISTFIYGYNYTKIIMEINNTSMEDVVSLLNSHSLDIDSWQNIDNDNLKTKLLLAKKIFENNFIRGYIYDRFGIREIISNTNNNFNRKIIRNSKGEEIKYYSGDFLTGETKNNYISVHENEISTENKGSFGSNKKHNVIRFLPFQLSMTQEKCPQND